MAIILYQQKMFRNLPFLTRARANHACFTRLNRAGQIEVVVAGGRYWDKPNEQNGVPGLKKLQKWQIKAIFAL